MTPIEYYWRHIHNPTRHYNYIAFTKPDNNGHTLGRLEPITPIYGYEFFYNPHRAPGKEKDYFVRCLQRLHAICRDSEVAKVFLIADYIQKPGNTFLDDYCAVGSLIQEKILSKVAGNSLVCIHRTKVSDSTFASNATSRIDAKCFLTLEDVPFAIESEVERACNGLGREVLTRLRSKLLRKELPARL